MKFNLKMGIAAVVIVITVILATNAVRPLTYSGVGLNFPVGKLPGIDSVMGVFRQGQKVGEVKVTGPKMDTNIAADITSGEVSVDDEVRGL